MANGVPPLCSGCANSAGSRVVPSRSSIAGEKDATSASPRSRPSSSGARLMSLSRRRLPQSWLLCRRRRSSPLFSRRRGTRSAPAWSPVWRDRAATSPVCRSSKPMLRPSDSNSCARLSPASADWRTTLEIRRGEDIAPAFEALKGRGDALYVCIDPLMNTHRIRINTLALAARLPTMHATREAVEAGGLMSYGANVPDLLRFAADYVDRILRGAKPGGIPPAQPRQFDLTTHRTTASA